MARAGQQQQQQQQRSSALFFGATMVLWGISVVFEISFKGKRDLLAVVGDSASTRGELDRALLTLQGPSLRQHLRLLASFYFVLILVNQWLDKGLGSMFDHSQLFGGAWWGAYTALCFSCGYFAYDHGWIPSILVHHLTLLVCFTLALYRNVTINYLILSLVCELHSIFLHVRKVGRMSGVRDSYSRIVRVEWALNWVAFFSARFLCHLLITYKLIRDAPKFGKGIELPLALLGWPG
ncbi:unnamed protein product [Spirodela intermedia]|uniref:TLC domain-containing protein n=1 Tax=Spirodela intermedia TaxID=51605 RepID=A0A7I8JE64_SPIIN|nr:unnamed protein product [Spirodela intermedia]CAA6667682.1 unnamed protein product [Spirodela intermedia]